MSSLKLQLGVLVTLALALFTLWFALICYKYLLQRVWVQLIKVLHKIKQPQQTHVTDGHSNKPISDLGTHPTDQRTRSAPTGTAGADVVGVSAGKSFPKGKTDCEYAHPVTAGNQLPFTVTLKRQLIGSPKRPNQTLTCFITSLVQLAFHSLHSCTCIWLLDAQFPGKERLDLLKSSKRKFVSPPWLYILHNPNERTKVVVGWGYYSIALAVRKAVRHFHFHKRRPTCKNDNDWQSIRKWRQSLDLCIPSFIANAK